MNSELLLNVSSLSYKTSDGRQLLQDLSFSVYLGDIVAIVGPNGVGKSTLLQLILGESVPSAGVIKLFTTSYGFLSQMQNREFHIPLRLYDVIQLFAPSDVKREKATKLKLLNENELDLAWNTASGGERQKTLLTGLLLTEPSLLILDEPLNHLDLHSRKILMDYLELNTYTRKCCVLMVSHEKNFEEIDKSRIKTLMLSKQETK